MPWPLHQQNRLHIFYLWRLLSPPGGHDFDPHTSTMLEDNQCPICYEKIAVKGFTKCEHEVCSSCLHKLVDAATSPASGVACPLCRQGCPVLCYRLGVFVLQAAQHENKGALKMLTRTRLVDTNYHETLKRRLVRFGWHMRVATRVYMYM